MPSGAVTGWIRLPSFLGTGTDTAWFSRWRKEQNIEFIENP
jgi:hypothetical protein